MPLTFPTLAEQCLAAFHSATRTTSISTIAARMGATRDDTWGKRVYVFPDDTTLETTGAGKNLRAETFHP